MKFTVFVLFALACSSLAIRPKALSSVQQQRITEIRKSGSWAGILLNLAQLHLQAKGPLEELVEAIQETIEDLGNKREAKELEFQKRTNEHHETVKYLEGEIAINTEEIAKLQVLLQLLADEKAANEAANIVYGKLIQEAYGQIAVAVAERQKGHADYQTKVLEIADAQETVQLCITTLESFANGGVVFAQVHKAKSLLIEVQKKLAKTKTIETAFLSALIEVTIRQEFADHGAVVKVIEKFLEIKANLQASNVQLAADEQAAQKACEDFVAATSQEIADNNALIQKNIKRNAEIVQAIADNKAILLSREAAKAAFEDALQEEHEAYADATERYNAYVAENEREVAVCNEALEVVSAVHFEDYIGDRVNAEDGLISSGMATSQQHGAGTEVFNFDYN